MSEKQLTASFFREKCKKEIQAKNASASYMIVLLFDS
jgi:hypothetical protein